MFFILGISKKLKKKIDQKVLYNGEMVTGIIKVYRFYFDFFFIPFIPLHRTYSLYIPKTDEYFENNYFGKMPRKYLDICKKASKSI